MIFSKPAWLRIRKNRTGNQFRKAPKVTPPNALYTTSNFLLLIHGFNVDWDDAQKTYSGFFSKQREVGDVENGLPIYPGRVLEVYWPGDKKDLGKLISSLSYSIFIKRAQKTAELLTQVLLQATRKGKLPSVTIDIIAHSLGCRVTMELLKILLAYPSIIVRRIVLMAAAVPTFMLDQRNTEGFRTVFYETVLTEACSLFSPKDWTLKYPFRMGQSIISLRGEGIYPVALGNIYYPFHPDTLHQHHVADAGHSDYWGHNGGKPNQEKLANELIRKCLKCENKRKIEARNLSHREISQNSINNESRYPSIRAPEIPKEEFF